MGVMADLGSPPAPRAEGEEPQESSTHGTQLNIFPQPSTMTAEMQRLSLAETVRAEVPGGPHGVERGG